MGIVKVQTTRMRGIPVYVLFGTRAWGVPGRFITGTQLVARIHRAYDLSGSNWISIYGPYTFKYGPCILRSLRDWPHSHSPRKDAASYIRASSYKRQLPAVHLFISHHPCLIGCPSLLNSLTDRSRFENPPEIQVAGRAFAHNASCMIF